MLLLYLCILARGATHFQPFQRLNPRDTTIDIQFVPRHRYKSRARELRGNSGLMQRR